MESGGEEVKLLGAWFSPFALRVEWALKVKGVSYEFVPEEDLLNKSSLLLTSNPIYKTIPVLLHDGKPILESLLIVEYIDECWSHEPLILPRDPLHRSLVKFWVHFIDTKLTEPVRHTIITQGEAQERKVKEVRDAFEVIEREVMVTEKKLVVLGGNTEIGLVDIALGWITMWLVHVEETAGVKIFDSDKYPRTFEWMNSFLELPVIKQNQPPRDKLAVYFTNLRQFLLASAATN